jgi:phospholipase C
MRSKTQLGLAAAVAFVAASASTVTAGVQRAVSAPVTAVAHRTGSTPVAAKINHIVVLMQENRSYDSYFGQLHNEGQPASEAEPTTGNPDPTNPSNPPIVPFHQATLCSVADLGHSWDQTHAEWNSGAMDGFTATNVYPDDPTGSRSMGSYDKVQLSSYYQMANTFGIGDRYFASSLTQTFPNRFYLLAGTSFGHIRNDFPPPGGWPVTTVFDRLDAAGVSWKVYDAQFAFASLFKGPAAEAATHIFPISQYFKDAAAGNLPAVTFVDPIFLSSPNKETDEHPNSNVQVGQNFVYSVVKALEKSPNWVDSAFFLTYDEHGGFYDHVAPPAAVKPDGIAPMLQPGDTPGAFDRYGIRVPLLVVSPYSKAHFVSHVVNDHTSILKFIENRYGLAPLSNRDAAANDLTEFFKFSAPTFATPPPLTKPATGTCWAQDIEVSKGAGAPTQLTKGDSVKIGFDLALAKPAATASIQVSDGDGTVAKLVNGTNATFKLNMVAVNQGGNTYPPGWLLTVTLTGPPIVTTPGSVPGVQFPAHVTAASGIKNTKVPGASWSLVQSPDLVVATVAGG